MKKDSRGLSRGAAGAKNGILFKTAESLEVTGRARTVVLDKTGTITKGEMSVTDIYVADGIAESRLVTLAASLEKQSEHPLARAIVDYAEFKNIDLTAITDFKAIPGKGVTGKTDGKNICGGNLKYIKTICQVSSTEEKAAEGFAAQGKTPMLFAHDSKFIGIIAVSDTIKDDSKAAIRELKNMGLDVVMLTGDNKKTARAIGELAGIEQVVAEVLPEAKSDTVKTLCQRGKVIMVGDGINDAPALAVADVGIAIGAGTDVAIDAADVVLMKSQLSDLVSAIKLSRSTLRNIRENLFWAFFYNVIGIPLAAGAWIPLTGWELNPMFGALAMSLSSFCVVSNALRLNLVKLDRPCKIKKKTNQNTNAEDVFALLEEKGEINMTKTIKIEGMMCPHCSGRVKKCLEAFDAVTSAEVSHESGTAIVALNSDTANDTLKKIVEDAGYTVIGIE